MQNKWCETDDVTNVARNEGPTKPFTPRNLNSAMNILVRAQTRLVGWDRQTDRQHLSVGQVDGVTPVLPV